MWPLRGSPHPHLFCDETRRTATTERGVPRYVVPPVPTREITGPSPPVEPAGQPANRSRPGAKQPPLSRPEKKDHPTASERSLAPTARCTNSRKVSASGWAWMRGRTRCTVIGAASEMGR